MFEAGPPSRRWLLVAASLTASCASRTFRHASDAATDSAVNDDAVNDAPATDAVVNDAPPIDVPSGADVAPLPGPPIECATPCGAGRRCIDGLCGPDAELATGYAFTCLRVDERVTCWGDNAWGEFATGDTRTDTTPGALWADVPPVKAVAASGFETYFVLRDGTVRFAGRNVTGSNVTTLCPGTEPWWCSGDTSPTRNDVHAAQAVPGLSNVRAVVTPGALGGRACALLENASVRCFGYNNDAALGIGTYDAQTTAVPPTNLDLPGTLGLGLTTQTACALQANRVLCWGGGALYMNVQPRPVDATAAGPRFPPSARVAGGAFHLCFVTGADQHVECGGWCAGTNITCPSPGGVDWTLRRVETLDGMPLTRVTQLAVGHRSNCARDLDGTVFCWGNPATGTLGPSGAGGGVATRVPLSPTARAVQVSVGYEHACALLEDGEVYCWGHTRTGAVGVSPATPDRVVPPQRVYSVTEARDR